MDGIQKLIEQYGLGSTVILFIIFVCACFGAIDLYRKGGSKTQGSQRIAFSI
jgi:hypothetical protein